MKEAPETARLTAPMIPLPPMPPPVLVAIWMASDIQENSPASDTMDSPSASESSSTGIVVPWIVSSMAWPPRVWVWVWCGLGGLCGLTRSRARILGEFLRRIEGSGGYAVDGRLGLVALLGLGWSRCSTSADSRPCPG